MLKNKDSSHVKNEDSSVSSSIIYIWPIHRHELLKFFTITLLMFCILCIQNLIRSMKDSIINTMIGTETITFLKFWGVLPASFIFTIVYIKLISKIKGEKIFYLITSSFLIFFFLFAFIAFPNIDVIHINKNISNSLIENYPHFKWFILLCSNWSFSLFYIIAELWPTAVFALLFWQFINNCTTIDESKRFYPLFGLFGQTGLFISGQFLLNMSSLNYYIMNLFKVDNINKDELTIKIIISVVTILGIISLITFKYLTFIISKQDTNNDFDIKVKSKTITLKQSFKMIMKSRYIRLISILLFCYGMTINLVEGPWKAEATKIYKTTTEFAEFQGAYLSYTGILTIIFVILGSNIVRKLGWVTAAIVTPLMVFVTGLIFFLVTNFSYLGFFMMMGFALTDPLTLAIIIGAIQNVLSKSSKYTLFDATKEMAYVPLDNELKTRGKAAADMIGTKLGKSASSLIQSIIFIFIPSATYSSISIYLMYIFIVISILWTFSVVQLGKEYNNECKKKLI